MTCPVKFRGYKTHICPVCKSELMFIEYETVLINDGDSKTIGERWNCPECKCDYSWNGEELLEVE